jgi:hypothetical protein
MKAAAVIVAVLSVAASACGGNDTATNTSSTTGSDESLVISGTAEAASSEPVSDSVAAPVNDPIDDPVTDPVDTVPDSVGPATPRAETPLAAGPYRTDKVVGPIVPIEFELPVDDLYVAAEEGFLGVNAAPGGEGTLVAVTQVDNGEVFLQPNIDYAQLPNDTYRAEVIGPAPADILTWLAARPGISAGRIVETTIAGFPARSMTYQVGTFDGALACLPNEARACHATLWAAPTGLGQVYLVGDSGTMFEVTVANQRFAVDVYDVEHAAEVASSLRFVVEPPPNAPAGSESVPFVGPHTDGAVYYSERSSNGLYLLDGVGGISSSVSRLRDPALVLEADGSECLSIVDGSHTDWLASSDPAAREVTSMPDDLIAAVVARTDLEVVAEPFPVSLGDTDARGVDVTPRIAGVQLANFSTPLPTGVVSRIIEVPTFDDDVPDLIVAILGSPCEQVLTSLQLVSGER